MSLSIKESAIEKMRAMDYWYNDIDSDENNFYIVFHGPYCSKITFSTWDEVLFWAENVIDE